MTTKEAHTAMFYIVLILSRNIEHFVTPSATSSTKRNITKVATREMGRFLGLTLSG